MHWIRWIKNEHPCTFREALTELRQVQSLYEYAISSLRSGIESSQDIRLPNDLHFEWPAISIRSGEPRLSLSSGRFCGTNRTSWTRDPVSKSRSAMNQYARPVSSGEHDIRESVPALLEIPWSPVMAVVDGRRGRGTFNPENDVSQEKFLYYGSSPLFRKILMTR